MGSLIVGPSESNQPDSTFDVGEMIRRKRIRDILSLARESTATDQTPEGLIPASPANPAGPVTNPSLYQTPNSTLKLKSAIEAAPDIANYHPGRVRDIFSRIAGVGAGLQGGLAAGDAARVAGEYQPFNRQMGIYQQKVAQAKSVSDIDQSIEASKMKAAQEAATIAHLGAQGEAEKQRALAEAARAKREGHESDILPPDWASKRDFELQKEALAHPGANDKPFLLHVDTAGNAITMDPKDGKLTITHYSDLPDKTKTEYQDFKDGFLKKHPNAGGDEIAKAYSDATQKALQISMLGPADDTGARKVLNLKPGQSAPAGSMTPGGVTSEQVNQDKSIEAERKAKKAAQDTAVTAERLVNQAEKAKDPSEAATADAALVMQLAGAIKPDALGKLRWNQSEQDFLIKKTRSAGGDFESLISKVTGGEHVILTSAQRKAFLQTIKTVAGGPETLSGGGNTLPGGISIQDIDAEIARRKAKK